MSYQWFTQLSSFLISSGYCQLSVNHYLFIHQSNSSFTALLVYVHDIIIIANDMVEINHMKDCLDATFCIKDLGELKFFLGLEIARSAIGISIY